MLGQVPMAGNGGGQTGMIKEQDKDDIREKKRGRG